MYAYIHACRPCRMRSRLLFTDYLVAHTYIHTYIHTDMQALSNEVSSAFHRLLGRAYSHACMYAYIHTCRPCQMRSPPIFTDYMVAHTYIHTYIHAGTVELDLLSFSQISWSRIHTIIHFFRVMLSFKMAMGLKVCVMYVCVCVCVYIYIYIYIYIRWPWG